MHARAMIAADAPAIHSIHTACLQRSLLGRYSAEQIEAWGRGRSPEGYIAAAGDGETFIVADIGGEVVGYASWAGNELLSLFVHPDRQGQGAGSMLVRACLYDASNVGGILTVVKATLGTEKFYRHHGFVAEARESTPKWGVEIPYILMRCPDTRILAHIPMPA